MTDLARRPGKNGTGSAGRTANRAATHTPGSQDEHQPHGFRPSTRRRNRIVIGVVLAALAIAGNLWVYSGIDDSEPVLQVSRDVPAGEQITADSVRTVRVDVDGSVDVVPADQLTAIVGTYAKVRLVSGSLVTPAALQPQPLVASGSSVVAILVPDGSLPIGLRERAPVDLVLPSLSSAGDDAPSKPTVVPGRVVGLPSTPDSAVGVLSLSVEVAAGDAALVAASDGVRVVLREPSADEAVPEGS